MNNSQTQINQNHHQNYYDGQIYHALVDPLLTKIRDHIIKIIPANSSVVDIGCGTGALALALAKHCAYITGVDYSEPMIAYARQQQKKMSITNVRFVNDDATQINSWVKQSFDFAILSLVLHETASENRLKLLHTAQRLAKNILVVDYASPVKLNLWGMTIWAVEFLAGRQHFRNFRSYHAADGCLALIAQLSSVAQLTSSEKIFGDNLTLWPFISRSQN